MKGRVSTGPVPKKRKSSSKSDETLIMKQDPQPTAKFLLQRVTVYHRTTKTAELGLYTDETLAREAWETYKMEFDVKSHMFGRIVKIFENSPPELWAGDEKTFLDADEYIMTQYDALYEK